ncbi:hypothetical protein L9F63_021394, partial [Diploptera punctata]
NYINMGYLSPLGVRRRFPFFVIHSDRSIPLEVVVRFQLPLVQDKIGLKELVASLDIHPSHARLEMCVDPGSYPASLDVQGVIYLLST